jgi:hypothetical protein
MLCPSVVPPLVLAITAADRAEPGEDVQSLRAEFDGATSTGSAEELIGLSLSRLAKICPLAIQPNGQVLRRTLAQLALRTVQAHCGLLCH